jgi:S1/P1 Nuclease
MRFPGPTLAGCLCSVQKDVLFAKPAALAATLLLYSPSALAWGGLGHEAVCELAFRELDDTARQRVIALIRQDEEFPTFRASCNWPDRPRQRASEHFVNLPRDATGLDDDECPMADECVVSAIADDFAVLASPNATDEEKLAALTPPRAAQPVASRPRTLGHAGGHANEVRARQL